MSGKRAGWRAGEPGQKTFYYRLLPQLRCGGLGRK